MFCKNNHSKWIILSPQCSFCCFLPKKIRKTRQKILFALPSPHGPLSLTLHVNMMLTHDYLYVPVFGHDHENQGQSEQLDQKVLQQINPQTQTCRAGQSGQQRDAVSILHKHCEYNFGLIFVEYSIRFFRLMFK